MNRRSFLGQVALGSAFLTAAHARTASAAAAGGLHVKFVGMMGFVERSDRSLLVAVPGHPAFHHYMHVPFLMARAGSRIATALGMTHMPGVVGAAFDYELHRAGAGPFVFRCIDGADLDITTAAGPAVDNQATYLAQMHRIAPGKRLRGNLQRWSLASVTLHGGQLHNAVGHPDAGRVFAFGEYRQPLTDAALYQAPAATIRLAAGREARSFTVGAGEREELWVVNAAADGPETQDPRRLEHGRVLFEYLVDATPVIATCSEAEGWVTPKTELPCAEGSSASIAGGAARVYPPFSEVCYNGFFGRA